MADERTNARTYVQDIESELLAQLRVDLGGHLTVRALRHVVLLEAGEHQVVDVDPDRAAPVVLGGSVELVVLGERAEAVRRPELVFVLDQLESVEELGRIVYIRWSMTSSSEGNKGTRARRASHVRGIKPRKKGASVT